jgi:hypothetical protein
VQCLADDKIDDARSRILEQYPHTYTPCEHASISPYERLKIYIRDGFIDRYTGKRLIFPNALRLLSSELGQEVFPYHPNWKMSECHSAYWTYIPTCDHLIPKTKDGSDAPENLVTTCMAMNLAKSNSSLEELGWKLYDGGCLKDWDGLMGLYWQSIKKHPELKDAPLIDRSMHNALQRCIKEGIVSF